MLVAEFYSPLCLLFVQFRVVSSSYDILWQVKNSTSRIEPSYEWKRLQRSLVLHQPQCAVFPACQPKRALVSSQRPQSVCHSHAVTVSKKYRAFSSFFPTRPHDARDLQSHPLYPHSARKKSCCDRATNKQHPLPPPSPRPDRKTRPPKGLAGHNT